MTNQFRKAGPAHSALGNAQALAGGGGEKTPAVLRMARNPVQAQDIIEGDQLLLVAASYTGSAVAVPTVQDPAWSTVLSFANALVAIAAFTRPAPVGVSWVPEGGVSGSPTYSTAFIARNVGAIERVTHDVDGGSYFQVQAVHKRSQLLFIDTGARLAVPTIGFSLVPVPTTLAVNNPSGISAMTTPASGLVDVISSVNGYQHQSGTANRLKFVLKLLP